MSPRQLVRLNQGTTVHRISLVSRQCQAYQCSCRWYQSRANDAFLPTANNTVLTRFIATAWALSGGCFYGSGAGFSQEIEASRSIVKHQPRMYLPEVRTQVENYRMSLSSCETAAGLVVIIDELRAFTTAAYLFSVGVNEIFLVSSIQETFNLRQNMPDCLRLGSAPGFDLGNSPSEILAGNLSCKRLILCTSAGTQCVVRASQARIILTVALTNISATVRYVKKLNPETLSLV
jgi:hypothetical protein